MSGRTNILFVATNGVGMGHLVRALAVARRLPDDLQPVIATFSTALSAVRHFGFPCEYLQGFKALEGDRDTWHAHLETEIGALLDMHRATTLVFDGNSPYAGLLQAIGARRGCRLVWIRRGMWKAEHGQSFLVDQRFCDILIEPGDVAGAADTGPTTTARQGMAQPLLYRDVAPITLLDRDELASREDARRELGLAPGDKAVLVHLGSGNIASSYDVVREVIETLRRLGGLTIFLAEWQIAERSMALWDDVRDLSVFPLARVLRAFDFSIGAAGYNSIHDMVNAALPTLIIPGAHPQLDDQGARARHLADEGAALFLPGSDLAGLDQAIDRLMDAGERQAMAARLDALWRPNGAREAADLVAAVAREASPAS